MLHRLKLPAPPEPYVSTAKRFPRREPTPEQQEARAALRAKAPRRRSTLAQRLDSEAGPSPGKTALGFAAGFGLTLPLATLLIAPMVMKGQPLTAPLLMAAVLGGLVGAAFWSRE